MRQWPLKTWELFMRSSGQQMNIVFADTGSERSISGHFLLARVSKSARCRRGLGLGTRRRVVASTGQVHPNMTRWLWYIILLTGSMPAAHATSCSQLQPCAYIRPESAVFIGTVESVEALLAAQREGMMGLTHRIRLTVKEVFVGLPAGTKEITITGWEMRVGKDYLIDGWRGTDGKVGIGVCSNTHESDEKDPYLRYLRLRQKGKA